MPTPLSLNQLSRRLQVPADWLKREADAGEIPCLKFGCRYLFNEEAVRDSLHRLAGKLV